VTLHLVGKKGNRIPPVTNQSQQGGSSLCVDVNRPTHSSRRDSPQSLEFWEDGRRSGQNRIFADYFRIGGEPDGTPEFAFHALDSHPGDLA
jgi:hypothetical protein